MANVQSMFGPNAAKYATSAVHANQEELQRLVKLVNPESTDRVLDVATGAGNMAFAFAPVVSEVIALDITEPMLEQVRLGATSRGLSNVSTLLGDACAIPSDLGKLDVISARLAPHHFPDIEGFVASAAAALEPGGKLLVSDTSSPDDEAFNKELDIIETLRDPSHVHNLTWSEWRTLFEKHGFQVIHEDHQSDWAPELAGKMDFDQWVERINTPQENRAELRRRVLEANDSVREGLDIELVGEGIAFNLPRITILGVKA